MVVNYTQLISPFDKSAEFLLQNGEQLTPFKKGEVRPQIASGAGAPKLDAIVPGLPDVLRLIPGADGVVSDLEGALQSILTFNIPSLLGDLVRVVPDTVKFVNQQLCVGLSLVAILDNAMENRSGIVDAVTNAYRDFFFGDGYKTLEGGSIAPPGFDPPNVEDLNGVVTAIRSYASLKTAEQYVRDLIRITVEAAGNQVFDLESRYRNLQNYTGPNAALKKKWFKGFSSLAESSVTSAVEEAAQGVSSFSSSPLIAASLGTFAGTAARKATQDLFLKEIEPL
jgi:hypothetical protein